MDILIATTNAGKVREYEVLLAGLPVRLLSLKDVGLDGMDVDESGETFLDNAGIKARAYAEASGKFTLADDSGLCVDALDGGPGVKTARYGGPDLSMPQRRRKLLDAIAHIQGEERAAHFSCVIALANPDTLECQFVEGDCHGHIAPEERDEGQGFGYDPIFIPQGYDRTFAQLPEDEKNHISHRGLATAQIIPILTALVENG